MLIKPNHTAADPTATDPTARPIQRRLLLGHAVGASLLRPEVTRAWAAETQADKLVMLDPGHGGTDPGAAGLG